MSVEISIRNCARVSTAGVRKTVPVDSLTDFFSEAFSETIRALKAQGIAPAGPPFGKYYGRPGATVEVEAGFPVSRPISPDGQVIPGSLPGGRNVEAVHVGPYDQIGATYTLMGDFIASQHLVAGDLMWESYLSDPELEPDPAHWRTLISWPVGSDAAHTS